MFESVENPTSHPLTKVPGDRDPEGTMYIPEMDEFSVTKVENFRISRMVVSTYRF